jgi:DNA invertase Pin-like site-specific DNA recombinase
MVFNPPRRRSPRGRRRRPARTLCRYVATALHELTSRGVHVRSVREGVDTSTPTGRAVTSIMATIAELELELDKERRAASREARVARGPRRHEANEA